MSYARFASDEMVAKYGGERSDIYVYLDVGGYFTCCWCNLSKEPGPRFTTTQAIVEHVREHQAAGESVPSYTITSLEAEGTENDAWIAGRA
jgi:hypothetical protein